MVRALASGVRPWLRWLALGIGCAALAGALVVVVPRLWIRTSYGHRTVERVLTRLLNERVPGVVTVGRLDGGLWTGLRANDVVVRNPDGAIVGYAPRMAARWRPLRLLFGRELEEVRVDEPVIALDRARWLSADSGGPARDTFVKLIIAHDGRVSWKQHVFRRVDGTATLHSSARLDVRRVSASVAGNAVCAFGAVGWAERQPTWVRSRFAVERPGQLRGHGQVYYSPEHLEVNVDALEIAAPLATRLVGGRGPLRLHGLLEGDEQALTSTVDAAQRGRTMRLRVVVDRSRRTATVEAHATGTRRPIRLAARLAYRPGLILVPTLHAVVGGSRVDGSGSFSRRQLRVGLKLHLLPSEARLVRLQPAAPIDLALAADGPASALDVRGQVRLEAARLAYHGRINLPSRAGDVRLFAQAVQPARLVGSAPAMRVSGSARFTGRLERQTLVGRARVAGGTLDVGGHRLSAIAADTPQLRLGRERTIQFRQLSGIWKRRRFSARGLLTWTGRRVEVKDAVADFAGAHAEGDARYVLGERQLAVHAAPLRLSRALVSRLVGRPLPRPWTGQVALVGKNGDATLRVETATIAGTLRATAHVLATEGANVDVRTVTAWLGDSHLYGALHYRGGHIDASVQELVLSPSLVQQLWPQLQPAWPIRVHGGLAGHEVLALRAELQAGPGTARISGRIAGRAFQLAAVVDYLDYTAFAPLARRVRGSFQLGVDGRFAQGGVLGTLTIRDAHGYILDSPFYRGVADARLQGRSFTLDRAVAYVPGARLVAKGSGALGGGVGIDYGIVITNALALRHVPKGMRTLIGINSMLPGHSVDGAITKQPGQPFQVTYHVLPIGLAQLSFLYRVLTGRSSWSETRLPTHQ